VWASWKRAWDLWNNHYIEGRVNPVWVAEEWERKKEDRENHDLNREERARHLARDRRNAGIVPRLPPRSLRGGRRFSHGHCRNPSPPPPATTGNVTEELGGHSGNLHHVRHSRIVPQWGGKKLEEEGDYLEDFGTEDDTNFDSMYQTKIQNEVDETTKRRRSSASNQRMSSPKKVKFTDSKEAPQSELAAGFVPLPPQQSDATLPKKTKTKAQREASSPTRTSSRKQFNSFAHKAPATGPKRRERPTTDDLYYDEFDLELPDKHTVMMDTRTSKPTVNQGNRLFGCGPGLQITPEHFTKYLEEQAKFQRYDPVDLIIEDELEEPEQEGGPEDGSSGGWVPIKNLPQYKFPEDPGLADDEEAQIAWENLVFDDVVENTVWRPRRVGEKTLKIDFDEEDPDEFPKNKELLVGGGVDCGREPYPVCCSLMLGEKLC
jgi:hypothetical protein